MTQSLRTIRLALLAGASVVGCLLGGLTGCSGAGPGINRPVASESASDIVARSPGVSSPAGDATMLLNFFDELEARPLAVHDDVLEGALVLGTGRGGTSFDDRVAKASSLGYINPGFNKPALEASTLGEVAQTLARVRRGGQGVTIDEAMRELIASKAIPPTSKAVQGVTGAQLVSVMGSVQDAMRASGVARGARAITSDTIAPVAAAPKPSVPKPSVPKPAAAVQANAPAPSTTAVKKPAPVATPAPAPTAASGAGSDDPSEAELEKRGEGARRGRPEALPNVPVVDEPRKPADPPATPGQRSSAEPARATDSRARAIQSNQAGLLVPGTDGRKTEAGARWVAPVPLRLEGARDDSGRGKSS